MIELVVRRAATVLLVTLCVLIFGTSSYLELPREAAPDIEIPVVLVTTAYPGVSPSDIESLITTPLENELSGVKKLKKMSSTSAEGVSIINLEFEADADLQESLQLTRDRVSVAESKLPEDALETQINEISFSSWPILIVTLAGPVDEEVLKKLGESLQDDLKGIPGVLDAKLTGGREREIRVQIDPVRLEHYGLSMDDVIGAIRSENVNIPGGTHTAGGANFLLRVPGEFTDPAEIEEVAIKRTGDRPVFVRDVGQVIDGFSDRSTYSRMNGETSVSVSISKRSGANILDLTETLRAHVDKAAVGWPPEVRYRALGDQSKMIRDMVSDLENGIISALILVVGVLMIFMGMRSSLFVALSIPLSFMLTMLVVSFLGMTLNMIVLFSLILALGMLVDNSIVIVENVYRHMELGRSALQASIEGTKEVAIAVASSTATTVAAFVPLLAWSGMMGQFMGYMPKTVVIVLTASLIVSLTLIPVATAKFMKVKRVGSAEEREDAEGIPVATGWVMHTYQRVLKASIRRRYLVSVLGIVTLVGTFAIYGAYNHGTEFLSNTEPNRATISVKAPDGTDVEATDKITRQVEGILAEQANIDVFVAEVGVSGDMMDPMNVDKASGNSARITIDFLPDEASRRPGDEPRVESTFDTIERIRQGIEAIPGAEITIEKENMGPPVGAPISVEVAGDDFNEVGEYAASVRRKLSGIEGTARLTDDYRVGRPELRLRIDRGAAKRVGASTMAVGSAIRTAIAGTKASTLRDGEDEYDIVVEVDPRRADDVQAILAMRIPGREDTSPDTFAVPLSAVASYEIAGGSGSIRHIDQDLVVTISGQIAEGYNENAVRAEVEKWLLETDHPAGFAARLGGAQDEQRETQAFLGKAFLVAIALIAFVLVTQFDRFDIPFIILASVVLSLIGVLWGLLLTGTPFGIMMTGLGVISLAGVVVNNAIVLLDYVQQLRARGMSAHAALVRAGTDRFRPVFLTAVTTVLGLVPMALGISVDFMAMRVVQGSQSSQWWGPMAVAVIFGLGFATVLTLVMVPTMYSIVEDLRGLLGRVRGRPPVGATPAVELAGPDGQAATRASAHDDPPDEQQESAAQ